MNDDKEKRKKIIDFLDQHKEVITRYIRQTGEGNYKELIEEISSGFSDERIDAIFPIIDIKSLPPYWTFCFMNQLDNNCFEKLYICSQYPEIQNKEVLKKLSEMKSLVDKDFVPADEKKDSIKEYEKQINLFVEIVKTSKINITITPDVPLNLDSLIDFIKIHNQQLYHLSNHSSKHKEYEEMKNLFSSSNEKLEMILEALNKNLNIEDVSMCWNSNKQNKFMTFNQFDTVYDFLVNEKLSPEECRIISNSSFSETTIHMIGNKLINNPEYKDSIKLINSKEMKPRFFQVEKMEDIIQIVQKYGEEFFDFLNEKILNGKVEGFSFKVSEQYYNNVYYLLSLLNSSNRPVEEAKNMIESLTHVINSENVSLKVMNFLFFLEKQSLFNNLFKNTISDEQNIERIQKKINTIKSNN